jgi:hypothetical protein
MQENEGLCFTCAARNRTLVDREPRTEERAFVVHNDRNSSRWQVGTIRTRKGSYAQPFTRPDRCPSPRLLSPAASVHPREWRGLCLPGRHRGDLGVVADGRRARAIGVETPGRRPSAWAGKTVTGKNCRRHRSSHGVRLRTSPAHNRFSARHERIRSELKDTLPIRVWTTPSGRRLLLIQTPRTFRGGFNFIF